MCKCSTGVIEDYGECCAYRVFILVVVVFLFVRCSRIDWKRLCEDKYQVLSFPFNWKRSSSSFLDAVGFMGAL